MTTKSIPPAQSPVPAPSPFPWGPPKSDLGGCEPNSQEERGVHGAAWVGAQIQGGWKLSPNSFCFPGAGLWIPSVNWGCCPCWQNTWQKCTWGKTCSLTLTQWEGAGGTTPSAWDAVCWLWLSTLLSHYLWITTVGLQPIENQLFMARTEPEVTKCTETSLRPEFWTLASPYLFSLFQMVS